MSKNEKAPEKAAKPAKPTLTPEEQKAANTASMRSARENAINKYGKDMSVPDEINAAFRKTVNTGPKESVDLERLAEVADANGCLDRLNASKGNTGQKVMLVRNVLRAMWKRGEKVKIGTAVLHDKEAEATQKAKEKEKAEANAARLAALKDAKKTDGKKA